MDTGSRGREQSRWSLGIWPTRLPDSVASTGPGPAAWV